MKNIKVTAIVTDSNYIDTDFSNQTITFLRLSNYRAKI